jgi:hypothetical protein
MPIPLAEIRKLSQDELVEFLTSHRMVFEQRIYRKYPHSNTVESLRRVGMSVQNCMNFTAHPDFL